MPFMAMAAEEPLIAGLAPVLEDADPARGAGVLQAAQAPEAGPLHPEQVAEMRFVGPLRADQNVCIELHGAGVAGADI